jgi:hypothetical protein
MAAGAREMTMDGGGEIQLRRLLPGTRFLLRVDGAPDGIRGRLLYVNDCRALVDLEPRVLNLGYERQQIASERVNWALETLVVPLEKQE